MQKIKLLNITELANAIGKTPQTLWNWKKGDSDSKLLLEGSRLGVSILMAGYSEETVVSMLNYGLNPSKRDLVNELDMKNRQLEGIRDALRFEVDKRRDNEG